MRLVLFFADFFAEEDKDFFPDERLVDFFDALDDFPEEDRDEDFLLELFFEDFFAAFFVAMALPPFNGWKPTKPSRVAQCLVLVKLDPTPCTARNVRLQCPQCSLGVPAMFSSRCHSEP